MIGRVVEIAGNDRHLSRYRGFMVVSEGREELGRIPLDDIAAVVVTARGASYTHKLLLSLAQKTVPLVLCNEKFLPEAWLWPVEGNHIQAMRMAFQVEAKRPLGKRLWQGIIKSKISHQAAVLEAFGKESEHLKQLIPKVRSGDPDNIEAKAARRYWLSLMGSDFRRERHGEGANPLLNYGIYRHQGMCSSCYSDCRAPSFTWHTSPQQIRPPSVGRRHYGTFQTSCRLHGMQPYFTE